MFALASLCSSSALADDQLLGLCSSVGSSHCTATTAFTVAKTALTPTLVNPSQAVASYQVTVTEGATTRSISLTDVLTLDGLSPSGNEVTAIFLGVQKSDGAGGWATLASGVLGDATTACGCPYVPGSMTLAARNGDGSAVSGSPLLTLAFGEQRNVALDLSWTPGALAKPGDVLRLQPCVAWRPAGMSLPAGCFADGLAGRAVKACAPFSLDSCTPQPATVTETLGALSSPIATLTAFTASTTSPWLTPARATQTAGGGAVTFQVSPSGTPGTQSVLEVDGRATCSGAGGTATLTNTAAVGASSATASIALTCPGASCVSLGTAQGFNVLVNHDFNGNYSDVEGAVAAGGSVTVSDYSIGAKLGSTLPLPVALVSGANLGMLRSGIAGDAWVVGATTLNNSVINGALRKGLGLDFTAAKAALVAASNRLASGLAKGTVGNAGGDLTLTGTDSSVNVFKVTSALLGSAWRVTVNVPATAVAVINVSGATASILNTSLNAGPTAAAERILYNFPQATAITMAGLGVQGSLLAPNAAVHFDNGLVVGSIFADSFTGQGQVNAGSPPICIPPPPVDPCYVDTTPPVLACPAVVAVTLSSSGTASYTPTATATDACGPATATCTTINATTANVGQTLSTTCTGTDASGNVAKLSCPAALIVAPPSIAVGKFCTYTQGGWGTSCKGGNPGCVRDTNWAKLSGSTGGCGGTTTGVVLGQTSPKQLVFTTSAAVDAFLPAGGTASALTNASALVNPVSSTAGVFAGQLLSLKLNVAGGDNGVLPVLGTVRLGDLKFNSGACSGFTVRQVLSRSDTAISGGTLTGACSAISDLSTACDVVNNNFDGCTQNLGNLSLP